MTVRAGVRRKSKNGGARSGSERVRIAHRIAAALDQRGVSPAARAFYILHGLALGGGVAVVIGGTVPSIAAAHAPLIAIVTYGALAFFTVEYVARFIYAPNRDPAAGHLTPRQARLKWIASFSGIIDLLAWLPFAGALALGLAPADARLFGVVWILKLGRHAPRLGLLGRVLSRARAPIMGVFFTFLIALVGSATLAYLIEGPRQPEHFGTIPGALWWAITTLTTTGYGDVVPMTPLGRLLAGVMEVCGILLFALWAGILATEFAYEMRRQEFLQTWDLVAKVPYFQDANAASIADVARLLKPREMAAGTIVMRRGEPGDSMYFIVEGEIEIRLKPEPVRLGPGNFFGEIALITGGPRTATAVARRKSMLLALDIVDFREIAARHPELVRAINEEARRRVGQSQAASGRSM